MAVTCLLVARGVGVSVVDTESVGEGMLVCDSVLPGVAVIEPIPLPLSERLTLRVNRELGDVD